MRRYRQCEKCDKELKPRVTSHLTEAIEVFENNTAFIMLVYLSRLCLSLG